MNHPIEERFKQLEERMQKVEQQQTEPIKVTVERRQADVERTIDLHTALLQEISSKQDEDSAQLQIMYDISGRVQTDVAILKGEMQGARADIIAIKATQSDHGELLKDMATKEDVSKLEARLDKLESEQGQKFDSIQTQLTEIVTLLQQKPS